MFGILALFIAVILIVAVVISVYQPTLSDDEREDRRQRNEEGVL